MDSAQYMDLLNSLHNTPPTKFLSEDWGQQPFAHLPDDLSLAGMPLSIPIPSASMASTPGLSPTGQSATSSVPSLISPTSDSSTPHLFTPPPLHEAAAVPTIQIEGSIFGALQDSYLSEQKPTAPPHHPLGSPITLAQQRRMSTPILTEIPSRRSLRRPSGLTPAMQQINPFLSVAEPVRRSISDSSSALPAASPLVPVVRSKTLMGEVQAEYQVSWPDLMQPQVLAELPANVFPPAAPYHYNVSGVNLGTEDLGMLDQIYQPAYYAYNNLPASAPAWRTSFDLPPMPALLPHSPPPPPSFWPIEQAHTPFRPLLDVPFRPASAPLARNHSETAAAHKPMRPMPKRRVTASASPQPAKRRVPSGPAQFVNFTSADASKLLNGVAPSGSSKRKREEEAAAAALHLQQQQPPKRRVVSA